MEALIKSCHLFFVCSGMPNVLQNNKLSISPGKVVLFSLFVACSDRSMEATMLFCCFSWVWSGWVWFGYLHLVEYPLKLPEYAILGGHCQA